MNSVGSSPNSPVYRFYADDGVTPLAGGFWYIYLAGTSTPAFAYSAQNLDPGSQLTNPIVLDANGEATVYFSPTNDTNEAVSYKWDVQDSDGNSIAGYPRDNISVPAPSAGANLTSAVIGFGATTTLTIAGGAITPTKNVHALNPEGGSADNLDTIVVDEMPDGAQLIISNANGAAAITVRDGVGNIFLSAGNYVMDTTDMRLVLVRDGASWYGVDRQAGVGDVVGPASSTDNAVARFDSTTGKLLQNSSAILSDAGLLTLPAGTGSETANVGGSIGYSVTSTGNSGTAETTLWSYTVPAATLAVDGDAIVFDAYGLGDSGSDTKTLRAYWAGVQIAAITGTSSPAGTFPDWHLRLTVTRSGATSQTVTLEVDPGQALSSSVVVTTGTATLANANDVRFSGQGASSNQLTFKSGRGVFQAHP
jgi:hypothetical protein